MGRKKPGAWGAAEEGVKEPGLLRYHLGRLGERLFGRLLCLLGRHRFREEGVVVCMRCLKLFEERTG